MTQQSHVSTTREFITGDHPTGGILKAFSHLTDLVEELNWNSYKLEEGKKTGFTFEMVLS